MPTRVPRVIPEFNAYIGFTDDYLHAASPEPPSAPNWQRLGLTQAGADQWHTMRQHWENELYVNYINPLTKTKSVNAKVAGYLDIFRHFAQPLLDRMAANRNATVADAAVFNFKIGRIKLSRMRTPIVEKCFISLTNLGGAMIRFRCHTMQGSGRPALPHGANAIMIAYKIGGDAPANVDDGTHKEVITRARGIKSLGIAHRGQRLYLFARWYNTRYRHFAGPWSGVVSDWV